MRHTDGQENTYFTDQLSPLEEYPLTLCGVTSRIKAGNFQLVLNVKLGYFSLRLLVLDSEKSL